MVDFDRNIITNEIQQILSDIPKAKWAWYFQKYSDKTTLHWQITCLFSPPFKHTKMIFINY